MDKKIGRLKPTGSAPQVYTQLLIEFLMGWYATTNRSGPFHGLEGQPRETAAQHQQGPI